MFPSPEQISQMLASGALGCLVAFGVLALCAILAFFFMMSKGRSGWRSLQFSLFVVLLALAVPALCGVATYISYDATASFMNKALRRSGVVVGLKEGRMSEGGTGYNAVVEFTPPGGSRIQFVDHSAICSPPCHSVGDEVTVIYDPENPKGASIDAGIINWIWVIVFGILTLVFLLLALGAIRRAYKSNSNSLVINEILNAVE